ncbi:MAG: hypothetical protein M1836_002822 [Candelina mexicana]|nr:MAG: hypothetical protein M1836_002822 [Candelina mexicana]
MTTLEQAQKYGVVIGLRDVTGEVRERVDIDTLLLDKPKTFNLFLLTLEHLSEEKESQGDKMGWFQIAGKMLGGWHRSRTDLVTHEPAFTDYQAETGMGCKHRKTQKPEETNNPKKEAIALITRNSLRLSTQSIYYTMLQIAKRFNNFKTHIDAAKELRLPYSDYFRPRSGKSIFSGENPGDDFECEPPEFERSAVRPQGVDFGTIKQATTSTISPKAAGEVTGLEVSVSSYIAYINPETMLPEEIGWQTYPEIMAGRAGGLAS